jgi:hypothetical protein
MAGPSTNRIGGVLSLTIDGQVLEARGNFQVTGPSVKRTGVAGQDGVQWLYRRADRPANQG